MRAEDNELVRLFTAAKFGNHVLCLDRAADCVGDGKIGVERFARRPAGAPYASGILARHQDHGQAVDFAVTRIGVAVEQVMRAGGLEGDRQALCL